MVSNNERTIDNLPLRYSVTIILHSTGHSPNPITYCVGIQTCMYAPIHSHQV